MGCFLRLTAIGLFSVFALSACPESTPTDELPTADNGQTDVAGDSDGLTNDTETDQAVDAPVDETVVDLGADTPIDTIEDTGVDTPGDLGEDTPTDVIEDTGEELADIPLDTPPDSTDSNDGDGLVDNDLAEEPDVPDVPVVLSFGTLDGNSLEIMIENDVPVKGYHFIASGVVLTSVGGGLTQTHGLNSITVTSGTVVDVLSFTGATIPPGSGVLVELEFNAGATAICLGDREFTGFVSEVDQPVESVVIPSQCLTF